MIQDLLNYLMPADQAGATTAKINTEEQDAEKIALYARLKAEELA